MAQSQVRFNRFRRRSGRLWCSQEKVWEALEQSHVRFNRVPEKVPEKAWEALMQSEVKFNRVPEKVPEKVCEALVQSPVRFNRVQKKVPEALVQSQVRLHGFRRRCGEGPGEGFGNLWCRARSGSTGSAKGFQRLASQHA